MKLLIKKIRLKVFNGGKNKQIIDNNNNNNQKINNYLSEKQN